MKMRIFILITLYVLYFAISCSLLEEDNPKVISSSPKQGEKNVDPAQTIEINFSKKMNWQKCIAGFSLQPNPGGVFESSNKTLTYTPSMHWIKGTTYIFTISQACEDEDGNDLKEPYTVSFSAGDDFDPPTINAEDGIATDKIPLCTGNGSTVLQNYDTGVCYNKNEVAFRITFSKEMDKSKTGNAFSISPQVEGSISWENNTMIFTPSESLAQNTLYKIELNTTVCDISGNNLVSNYIHFFTTGGDNTKPYCTSVTSDRAGSCDGLADDNIDINNISDVCVDNDFTGSNAKFIITFSERMEPHYTRSAFSITPNVSGVLTMENDNTELVFVSDKTLNPDTTYQLSVSTSARDDGGNQLDTPLLLFFRTSDINGNPEVTNIEILSGETYTSCNGTISDILNSTVNDACMNNSIRIFFSEEMNPVPTKSSFAINPTTNGTTTWNLNNTIMTFVPDHPLEYGRRYTVGLSTQAEDRQGQKMDYNCSADFVVGEVDNDSPDNEAITVDFTQLQPDGSEAPLIGSGHNSTTTVNNNIILDGTIHITFPEEMDPQKVLSGISLSPSKTLIYSWGADTSQLDISSISGLDSDTEYTLKISKSVTDLAGNDLDDNFVLTFSTVDNAPYLTAIGLESHNIADWLNAEGVPDADKPWNASDTGYCWWSEGHEITAFNDYLFAGGDEGVQNAGLCATDDPTDNIVLVFNHDMDQDSLLDSISVSRITGESSTVKIIQSKWLVDKKVISLLLGESKAVECDDEPGRLGLETNLANNNGQMYKINISTSAKDVNGNRLGKPFTFYFQEAP